jgi:hypothetical protein
VLGVVGAVIFVALAKILLRGRTHSRADSGSTEAQ